MIKIITTTNEQIDQADLKTVTTILRKGGVIALPTDTAYALAADATNPQAVKKVFAIKSRPRTKRLSWFFSDLEMVKKYCRLNNAQQSILNARLPGLYTFIVQSKIARATIGVRITNHPITQTVVSTYGKPLTATSANRSGQPPARSVQDLEPLTVDLILDAGVIPQSLPSTVVDLTKTPPIVGRAGAGEWPS